MRNRSTFLVSLPATDLSVSAAQAMTETSVQPVPILDHLELVALPAKAVQQCALWEIGSFQNDTAFTKAVKNQNIAWF